MGSSTTAMNDRIKASFSGGVKCFKRYRRDSFISAVEKEIAHLAKDSQPTNSTEEVKSKDHYKMLRKKYLTLKRE